MDLAQVKVVVKAWEKAFKAKHARPPTKDDIKADGGGIGMSCVMHLTETIQDPERKTSPCLLPQLTV